MSTKSCRMKRRDFLTTVAAGAAALGASAAGADAAPAGSSGPPARSRLPAGRALADQYVVVYASPDPANVYASSPGLALLPGGRLIATLDLTGRYADLPGVRRAGSNWLWRGKVFTSDDRGRTWVHRSDIPMEHARPFAAGDAVYVLGHAGDLLVMRSDDRGDTWSAPAPLTSGQTWHQAPSNVHYAGGRVYLVMERDVELPAREPSGLAPVLMSARVEDDLRRRESWVFSNELSFNAAVRAAGPPHLIGVPFFAPGLLTPDDRRDQREMDRPGWLETNVVQITDPDHDWYDPAGRTFHLLMRAQTGTTNLACLAKAVETPDRAAITVSLERAPSGEPMLYVPCPGGHLKFHVLYDDVTRLYWLLSSQATDSMRRPDRLPANRYGLPNNERHRLALHFSRNCVDWCFAGLVANSVPGQSRHYASMVIDGADLHVLSRSGDARAANAHDCDLITFHTVRRFRGLVY